LGTEAKSPAAHMQILSVCLSVCPYLVRYLLRDGWVDWAEILHRDAGGLNLGFPPEKSEKTIYFLFIFLWKKNVFCFFLFFLSKTEV
jgi:hypothetical protein